MRGSRRGCVRLRVRFLCSRPDSFMKVMHTLRAWFSLRPAVVIYSTCSGALFIKLRVDYSPKHCILKHQNLPKQEKDFIYKTMCCIPVYIVFFNINTHLRLIVSMYTNVCMPHVYSSFLPFHLTVLQLCFPLPFSLSHSFNNV